jgi:hypothetical protein
VDHTRPQRSLGRPVPVLALALHSCPGSWTSRPGAPAWSTGVPGTANMTPMSRVFRSEHWCSDREHSGARRAVLSQWPMKGFALYVWSLVACGSSRQAPIDAAVDAAVDAMPDARVLPVGSKCVSSADCGTDPTQEVCCLVIHAGGGAEPSFCSPPMPQPPFCEVACDPASRAPCITVDGKAGACAYAAFGPSSFSHYWVCRSNVAP